MGSGQRPPAGALGFCALATTSGGFANALGRADGEVTREEAVAHGGALVEAVGVPVSADLENGFGDDPEDCAATIEAAAAAGLAGASIEDHRVRAGASTRSAMRRSASPRPPRWRARTGSCSPHAPRRSSAATRTSTTRSRACRPTRRRAPTCSTRRASPDLDAIRRIVVAVDQAGQRAADPGLTERCRAADAGVARISIGATFAHVAMGAVTTAARELLEQGTYGCYDTAKTGRRAAHDAFE